jgi:hypothetical protein
MADGASCACLVEKTPDQFRVLRQRRVQYLHGGAALDERVLGKVDLPEPAFAE